jgi:hypothetical protein
MYVISTPFLSQIRARSSATNFSARALELALFLLPEYHHTVDLSYARASSFIFKQSPQSSGPHDSPSAHVHERCLDVPCRLNSFQLQIWTDALCEHIFDVFSLPRGEDMAMVTDKSVPLASAISS